VDACRGVAGVWHQCDREHSLRLTRSVEILVLAGAHREARSLLVIVQRLLQVEVCVLDVVSVQRIVGDAGPIRFLERRVVQRFVGIHWCPEREVSSETSGVAPPLVERGTALLVGEDVVAAELADRRLHLDEPAHHDYP
jgi:hypothetical protein